MYHSKLQRFSLSELYPLAFSASAEERCYNKNLKCKSMLSLIFQIPPLIQIDFNFLRKVQKYFILFLPPSLGLSHRFSSFIFKYLHFHKSQKISLLRDFVLCTQSADILPESLTSTVLTIPDTSSMYSVTTPLMPKHCEYN